jgi:hypothetical protein
MDAVEPEPERTGRTAVLTGPGVEQREEDSEVEEENDVSASSKREVWAVEARESHEPMERREEVSHEVEEAA